MLRVDNGSFLENSKNITYAKTRENKCATKRQQVVQMERRACDPNADAVKLLDDFHRKNACSVHTCVPQKKCMAKVGLHDSNGNFLYSSLVGANLQANLRTGGNQVGYVYQEKSINNTDALADALRNNNPVAAGIASKIAQSNAELYGKPHAWDGSDHGYFCVKCPPKPKPCPRDVCKKADPLFNPTLGIGSDGLEAKQNLREINDAQVFRQRQVATATTTQGVQAVAQTTESGGNPNRQGRPRGGERVITARRPQPPAFVSSTATTAVGTPRADLPTLDDLGLD